MNQSEKVMCPKCSWRGTAGRCVRGGIERVPAVGAAPERSYYCPQCMSDREGVNVIFLAHEAPRSHAKAMNEPERQEIEAQILKWSAEPPNAIEIAMAKRLYWETAIRDELHRAKAKFPEWPTDPIHAFAIVAEEFGEAAKEVLQLTYEPEKSAMDRVRAEAIQLAAMCHRFLESLDRYVFQPSDQHRQ